VPPEIAGQLSALVLAGLLLGAVAGRPRSGDPARGRGSRRAAARRASASPRAVGRWRRRGRRRQRVGVLAAARARIARPAAINGRGLSPRGLLIGLDHRGGVRIPFGGFSGVHTLVVGATGSGKTVTQALIAAHAIAAGHAAIVIDPKGDDGLRSAVKSTAELAGAAFCEWTPDGPCIYNPYARGSDTRAGRQAAGRGDVDQWGIGAVGLVPLGLVGAFVLGCILTAAVIHARAPAQ
jgi:hypothetical protein